jgi:hypothetical protein
MYPSKYLVIQERDMRGFDDIPRGCMECAGGLIEHHIALLILWLNTCLIFIRLKIKAFVGERQIETTWGKWS